LLLPSFDMERILYFGFWLDKTGSFKLTPEIPGI
jgi:hypothetical protein